MPKEPPATTPMDRIRPQVEKYQSLTSEIKALDFPPQLCDSTRLELETAQGELTAAKRTLKIREDATKGVFTDWQALQSSTSTRLFYKMRHPRSHDNVLSTRTTEQQQEYETRFALEQEARQRLTELEANVPDLEGKVDELTRLTERHAQMRRELLELYERVFKGPTPEYPDEDEAEQRVEAVLPELKQLHGLLAIETRAQGLLGRTLECIERATEQFERTTKQYSGKDEAELRRKLNVKAEYNYDMAVRLFAEARVTKPSIPPFTGTLPSGGYFRPSLVERTEHCRDMVAHVDAAIAQARAEGGRLGGEIASMSTQLHERRALLEDVRRRIMDEYAAEMGLGVAPPVYSAET